MKTKKSFLLLCAAFCVLLTVLVGIWYQYHSSENGESPLYSVVAPYRERLREWSTPQHLSFAADSAESLFLEGMELFAAKDYDAARRFFEQALDAQSNDPALPTYLYYYINECAYLTGGKGDPELVTLALAAAAEYHPLANDEYMLWSLVSTIALSPESDAEAIRLMQSFLDNTKDLDLATWAHLKNCIAYLQYNNEEFASCIRNFYDVELKLENVELTPALRSELLYAKEFIANIYYIFEDYEKTVARYQELAEENIGDLAFGGFSHYINMATAYLELSDTENAKNAILALQTILPQLAEDVAIEVEASMNRVLASICMTEEDYAAADIYLIAAEEFFKDHDPTVFYGDKYFVRISRCEYWIHKGELAQAQEVLESLLNSGEAAYYGLEEEIYDLLLEIYQKTGQDANTIKVYQDLLALDEEFAQTTQREYLAFSEYYRDVNRLEAHNTKLSRTNSIAFLVIFIIAALLIVVLFFVRLLRAKNITDQLTGVYNRKKLNQLTRSFQRAGTPENLGVVMMDIDYFKRYNDTYGHPAGDEILKQVANVLTTSVRSKDTVIRYGGEEFIVLLSGVTDHAAEEVCNRIHQQLKLRAIPHEASDVSEYVTLSMGLCHLSSDRRAPLGELIRCADEALYHSKENGRNQVTVKKYSHSCE